MTARDEARKLLLQQVASALKGRGFTRVRGTQRFERPVLPGVTAQLGFASATKQSADRFWIDTSAGVLVEEVRDLFAAWTRLAPQWTTVYTNVGHLPPSQGWSEVPLATTDEVPDALAAVLGEIDGRTADFFASCHRPGYLADLVEGGVPTLRPAELVAVLRAVDGDADAARRAFAALQAQVESSLSPALRELRFVDGFATHFRDLLD